MKLIAILMLTGVSLCAQGTNTIYSVLFQNSITTPTATGVSTVVRNIGQQYHALALFAQPTASASCTSGGGRITLEGSSDNVNYFPIGAPIVALKTNVTAGPYTFNASTSASGAYNYVRANYSTAFGTGCSILVTYAGTVTGSFTSSAPFAASQDTFVYTIGSVSTTGSQSIPIASCDNGQDVVLYALAVTAPGGANSAALAEKVVVGGSPIDTIWTFTMPLSATNNFTLQQGSRPYVFTHVPNSEIGLRELFLTLGMQTEVDYIVSYRCE